MNNENIHLVKAAFHGQFKLAMESCDISPEYYFRRVNLPLEVSDPEAMLPLKPFYHLINSVAINENMPGFGCFVAQSTPWHKVLSLGPLIGNSENLKDLLEKFCEIASSQSSHVEFSLVDEGTHFDFCYTDIPVYKGDIQMELYRVTCMIQLVQLASGAHWSPEIIRLIIPETTAVGSCSLLTKSKISFSQANTTISIPADVLQLPVRLEIPASKTKRRENQATINTDLAAAIRQIINTYALAKNISIGEVASIADMSVRSLQRRLKENGLKFNDLMNQAKFAHAGDQLRDTKIPVKEIAASLGYSDPAHFTRAFRRWSGLAPNEFRKNL
jgi:AraC-like DNA-binding protein